MLAGRKYKSMWKLLASTQFESPFEITKEIKKFVAEYGLAKDFDKKKIDGEEEGKLKKEAAEKLLKTSTVFIQDNPHKEERLERVKNGIRSEVLGLFRTKHPDLHKAPNIQVEIIKETVSDTDYWNVYLVMSLGNSEVERDLESLRYSGDPAEIIAAASESYDWCAWLGIPESPFFDEAFVDEYAEDQASYAIEQFWHTRSETEYFKEINEAIKELADGYEPQYEYIVDLDERGSFRAHVEDPDGKEVFTFNNEEKDEETGQVSEAELWLVRDGFMKNTNDLEGLKEYCVEHKFMPEHATLVKGN